MTPFRTSPVKWDGKEESGRYRNENGFKYDVVSKSVVDKLEDMPKCFLAETPQEAEAIYKQFERALNNYAYSYSVSTGVDKAELFREALIGLARAVRDWDPERSDNFGAYATFRIKDALNEFVHDNKISISIPAYVRKASANLMRIHMICERTGVNWRAIVLDHDIPLELSMADAIECARLIENIIDAAERAKVDYFKFIERISILPEEVEYSDQIEPKHDSRGQEKLEAALLVAKLKEYMDKEELSICEGIMLDKSYEEIGKEMGRSKGWVSNKLKDFRNRIMSTIRR